MQVFRGLLEFEWDKGNSGKNFVRHGVADVECEEAFFDNEKKVISDTLHSGLEPRYLLLGSTKQDRMLFIVFTVRHGKIRIILARDLNRKEVKLYTS